MQTYAYGFPRIGENREYKKAIESFWKGESSEEKTREQIGQIQETMLAVYERSVDRFPVGEMTFYDSIFDTAVMLGVYQPKNLNEYYNLCRGQEALEMTKWFNTNYHYLVPDFAQFKSPNFSIHWNKPQEYLNRYQKGIPFLIGPFTFLKLSKGIRRQNFSDYLLALGSVYGKILQNFQEVHMEEPAFVLELTASEIKAIKSLYRSFSKKTAIHLFTYYESVDFLRDLFDLPIKSIGLDFVHGTGNWEALRKYGFPEDKTLIAGVVDGRNIWKTDLQGAVDCVKILSKLAKKTVISNAAPLYHLPVSVKTESLDPRLMQNLAFAKERLEELRFIAEVFENKRKLSPSKLTGLGGDLKVQKRVGALKARDFQKSVPLLKRRSLQQKILSLPLFPTTTIGSFPQTAEVRKKRAEFRARRITAEQYQAFVQEKIAQAIKLQEELGLDVLVHGEFERTDMVEFFAERLEGITTTQNGWIISYGTRVYRPPIIFGDVARVSPMTLPEIRYAQSLTAKPVKGMLTGPVTIIAWSFVREDIPIREVAYQLALALQDEIRGYEKSGIKIVQIDEPAFREKAPLKKRDWPRYFDWAIKAFRLATNTDAQTQIHTHMCYSEFGEVVKEINKMDFDVISIEATRSRGDIIKHFEKIDFKRQIGLGVWDIHSPAVPSRDHMREIVQRALQVIPKENFWINPDCGLKTRTWEETIESLRNLVALSRQLRRDLSNKV